MFDRSSTLPRRALAAGTAGLMALSLGSLGGGSAQAQRPGPAAGTTAREAPGPIHAGNTFGWYGHGGLIDDETFVGPLAKRRHVEGQGAVRNEHGMLTLKTANKGPSASHDTIARPRLRPLGGPPPAASVRKKKKPYRVLTELVPVTNAGEGCGEQNLGSPSTRWATTRSTSTSAAVPTTSISRRSGAASARTSGTRSRWR